MFGLGIIVIETGEAYFLYLHQEGDLKELLSCFGFISALLLH